MSKDLTIYITTSPIERKFQESIGIYNTGVVHPEEVGRVISALVTRGYTEQYSVYTVDRDQFDMHFTKPDYVD